MSSRQSFFCPSRLRQRLLEILSAAIVVSGCVPQQVSVSYSPTARQETIRTIAISPGGGALADAVGVKLLRYGFQVFDAGQVSNLMVRLNLNEVELYEPQNLRSLKNQGIDAILHVRAIGGYDGRPDSAAAKVTSTADGQILAGLSWENRRAGARGSPAEGFARVGLEVAAETIVEHLVKGLPIPRPKP